MAKAQLIVTLSVCLFSLAGHASETLKIGNVDYFGGTYTCANDIKVNVAALDLPAVPQARFIVQLQSKSPELQTALQRSQLPTNLRPNTVGEKLANGDLQIAGGGLKIVVGADYNAKVAIQELLMRLGTDPSAVAATLDCKQTPYEALWR